MEMNLRHIVVESWRFYLTWLIYIIGTQHFTLLPGIHNDCIVCDFAGFI